MSKLKTRITIDLEFGSEYQKKSHLLCLETMHTAFEDVFLRNNYQQFCHKDNKLNIKTVHNPL
jgi:hypothetical protein